MIDSTGRRLLALIGAAFAAGTAQTKDLPAQALMHEHNCYLCHADSDALAGPAFVDVAAKFRGNPNAIALLVTFVRRGEHGGGPWHMPPHPEVSGDEATAMARYILSLDASPGGSPGATQPRGARPAKDASHRS